MTLRWCFIVMASLLTAQEPPLVRDAPNPATPSRIRLSCAPQRGYFGPAQQWFPVSDSLSDQQIADLENVLAAHPDDICARGYLIAHGNGHVSRHLEHGYWMTANHSAWDGFPR